MGKVAEKRKKPSGKPAMDDIDEINQMQPRQKEYCDFRLKGYSKEAAGRALKIPAKEEAIKVWENNKATAKYIRSKGGLPKTVEDQTKKLYQDMEMQAVIRLKDDIKEGKSIDSKLYDIVMGIRDKIELEGSGEPVVKGDEKKVGISYTSLIDELPEEDRASLQEKKGKIKRRKIEVDKDD